MGGYSGPERTDSVIFTLGRCGVLKGLVVDNFHIGSVCWVCADRFWTFATLKMCGGLERTGFQQIPFWEDVMVLKALILGGLERSHFCPLSLC